MEHKKTEQSWSARYELGVELLDAQHRRLFDLVRAVQTEAEKEAGGPSLTAAVQELAGFARLHFETEEKLMEEHDFSTAGFHRQAHKRLLQDLAAFSGRVSQGMAHGTSVSEFLRKWVNEHVSHGDAMLARHLKSRGY